MSVTLSGTLLTPVGDIAANAGIRITSLGLSANDLGKGAVTEYQCSPTGTYSLTLVDGNHRIEYRYGQNWIYQGDVVVNADTPAVDTLYELLNATTPVTPEIVQQLQQILTDAEAARDAAQSAEAGANASAESLANAVASNSSNAALSFAARRQANRERYGASRFVHWGKHRDDASYLPIGQGLYAIPSIPDVLGMGRSATASGDSETNPAILHVAGVLFNLSANGFGDPAALKIKFPDAPDGTVTYDSANGTITQHADAAAAFAAETATNKVVTERYDVPIFEVFKREIKIGSDEVYPNGLIQSQATTMNGIATTNGTRPATYYAAFEGDTGSIGKCLNYYSLSEAQQAIVLADPWNNFELGSDGKLYQWCLRQKTFAGRGNGRWLNLTSQSGDQYLRFSSISGAQKYVNAQGDLDSASTWINDYPVYVGAGRTDAPNDFNDLGVFKTVKSSKQPNTTVAVDGECYALVLAQVSRLNQGAYHPSFNSLGARLTTGGNQWWQANNLTDEASCFDSININQGTGYISSGFSGRPDGKFYDAIYADGQGGVIDMRLGGKSLAQFGDDKAALLAGDFRGEEYLPFTRFVDIIASGGGGHAFFIHELNLPSEISSRVTSAPDGTKVHLLIPGFQCYNLYTNTVNTFACWKYSNKIYVASGGASSPNSEVLVTAPMDHPVSGEFTMLDVIGDPANIKNTPDLASGWLGGWVPVIPDGTSQEFPFTRKSVASTDNHWYTTDNGATWTAPSGSFIDSITNSRTFAPGSTQIAIYRYTAHATVTDPVNRTKVLGGADSITDVTAINWRGYGNNILFESLMGMININSNSTGEIYPTAKMIQSTIVDRNITVDESIWGRLSGSVNYGIQKHEPITLVTPNNGNSALKVLMYPVVINGQLHIEMAYKQMIHNGTSWGDNDQMVIVDNNATGTDINGQTIKYGTHRTGVIGWPT